MEGRVSTPRGYPICPYRLPDRFGVPGRHHEQHPRGTLGGTTALLPVAQRACADANEAIGGYFAALTRRQPAQRAAARRSFQNNMDLWRDYVRRGIAAPYASAPPYRTTIVVRTAALESRKKSRAKSGYIAILRYRVRRTTTPSSSQPSSIQTVQAVC